MIVWLQGLAMLTASIGTIVFIVGNELGKMEEVERERCLSCKELIDKVRLMREP